MRRSSSISLLLSLTASGTVVAIAAACNTAELQPQGPVENTTIILPDGSTGDDAGENSSNDTDGSLLNVGSDSSTSDGGNGSTGGDDASDGSDGSTTSSTDGSSESGANGDDSSTPPHDSGTPMACASSFGSALTTGFGRVDGTLYSIVRPTDSSCQDVDTARLTLEVEVNGAVYRFLVNLQTALDAGTPNVYEYGVDHALLTPAFSTGWHSSQTLDYASDLGVHSTGGFVQYPAADLQTVIENELTFGANISIYAYAFDSEAARYIYREANTHDGAIVIGPDTANPHWLLFHFDGQTF